MDISWEKIMHKIKKHIKNKKIILIIIAIMLFLISIIFGMPQIVKQIIKKQIENRPIIEYEIKNKIDSKSYQIVVKVNNVNGIESVKYTNSKDKEITINSNGKLIVALDYVAQDNFDYEFKIKVKGEEEKTEILHFEIPRIKGNYTLNNGIYVNEPDLNNYNKN